MTLCIAVGTVLGLASGLVSAYFVEKARRGKSNAVFMQAWGLALLGRFLFVLAALAAVWKLRPEHPLALLLSLVLAQTAAQFIKPNIWALRK